MKKITILILLVLVVSIFSGCISRPDPPPTEFKSEFTADTLSGGTVTEAIFAENDITMINIWTTWCDPAVEELSGLSDFYINDLPENCGMITFCADAKDESALAKEDVAGLSFETIVPDDELKSFVASISDSVPSAIFVDNTGAIIGLPLESIPKEGYSEFLINIFDERLNTEVEE